ncbi:MAG: trypsin-like serine protease [Pseudomonadota bacterium]
MLGLPVEAAAQSTREALPGIVGQDDRVALDPTSWPWHALGRVNQGTGAHCTGTLIAEDRVLTAAHCVHHARTGRPLRPRELHFVAGYRRGDYLAHARGKAVVAAPDYAYVREPTLEEVARDWALIRLDRPLAITPIPMRSLPADSMHEGRLQRAGYSQDRAHLLSIHDGCHVRQRLAEGRVLFTDCDGTRGDSGSPILLREGEQVWLVGVSVAVVDHGSQEGGLAIHAGHLIDEPGFSPDEP